MTTSNPQAFSLGHLDYLNANTLGELLRSLVFDQSEGLYGCYSTFETNPGFDAGDERWRREFWAAMAQFAVDRIVDSQRQLLNESDLAQLREQQEKSMLDEELLDELATMSAGGGQMQVGELVVNAAWAWDGDGILAFMICRADGEILRVIENSDCKKPHNWEDFGDEDIAYLTNRFYGIDDDDEYGPY